MQWKLSDIDTYMQAREYVDTALLSLIPIHWSGDLKLTVSMGEYIILFSEELERQFKGRIVQFPSFTYLTEETIDEKQKRLQRWVKELRENGFEHILFLTSDVEWKQVESELDGTLIWMPALPLEHADEQYKDEMLMSQMKQIVQLITTEWQRLVK